MDNLSAFQNGAMTRESGLMVTAYHPTLRLAEDVAMSHGFSVSKSSLHRARSGSWHSPGNFSQSIIEYCSHYLASNLAVDCGEKFMTEDATSAMNWIILNRSNNELLLTDPLSSIWAEDEEFCRLLLRKPRTYSLIGTTERASACSRLSRNPQVGLSERDDWRNAAIEYTDETVNLFVPDYGRGNFNQLLGAHNEFLALPESDFIGILVSTNLNLQNQAYAAFDLNERWRKNLRKLDAAGLIPQMAVRGIFFREPVPLLNTAEALWVLDQKENAKKVISFAEILDLDRLMTAMGSYLHPQFVTFVQKTLQQTR